MGDRSHRRRTTAFVAKRRWVKNDEAAAKFSAIIIVLPTAEAYRLIAKAHFLIANEHIRSICSTRTRWGRLHLVTEALEGIQYLFLFVRAAVLALHVRESQRVDPARWISSCVSVRGTAAANWIFA
jgi:hypothetical protein